MARKTKTCEECGKERHDLISVGEISVCFFCHKEWNERGRGWNRRTQSYERQCAGCGQFESECECATDNYEPSEPLDIEGTPQEREWYEDALYNMALGKEP